jgi:nucleoside-diphosphate-sugar epimerase
VTHVGGNSHFQYVRARSADNGENAALEQQGKGVFNIVDDEPAQVREWLPYLAESAGARRPMRLPKWVAQLLAGEMVKLVTEGCAFSNAKAKRELGWELRYPSWRQGFKEELA